MSKIPHIPPHMIGKADRLRRLAVAPANPKAGDVYYDTADEVLYTYDATRSAWLGPPVQVTANNISAATTMYLRFGNQISSGTRGWPTPYAFKIVGGAISSGAAATADLQARVAAASQGVVVALAGGTTAASTSTNIDIAAGVELALYLTASVGTPSAVIATIIIRRKKV